MPPFEDAPLALVVDECKMSRTRLCRALVQRKWEADTAPGGEEALQIARDRSPDLVLVDLRMPGKSGLEIVRELRTLDSSMTIIVLTGYGHSHGNLSDEKGRGSLSDKAFGAIKILAAYDMLRSNSEHSPEAPQTVPTLARVEWDNCSASSPIAMETSPSGASAGHPPAFAATKVSQASAPALDPPHWCDNLPQAAARSGSS